VESAIEELQELATAALKANNYSDVADVVRIAEVLHYVLDEDVSQPQQPPVTSPGPKRQKTKRATSAPRKRSSSKYPMFRRDDDKLVKVGWSKKARKEYEHRAPEAAIEALLASIQKRFGEGEYFTAPDVLPITARTGDELPDYQAYLVMKWLHSIGLIVKKGRDQYALAPGKDYEGEIQSQWNGLKSV
jgi:hypothetical protein